MNAFDVNVTWDFEPDCSGVSAGALRTAAPTGPTCDLEVVVPMDFADWRPQAGDGGKLGNTLTLTAKLQAKGGGPTTQKATEFKWEWVAVSQVPGYAMNAPEAGASFDPDMKFEFGADFVVCADGKSGCTPPGSYSQSRATIGSYDWGGYAKIKVSATVPNVKDPIVGYLEGDPAQTEIRVPKRSETSQIADVWKKDHSVTGLDDTDDSETSPPGDGHPGDGLTLYEEYRGFIIDGKHDDADQADPHKKDLFIVNTSAGYLLGIKMFEKLSQLKVHYNLKRGELEFGRVINFNYDFTPNIHKVNQHGLIIEGWDNPGLAKASPEPGITHPGPPVTVQTVHVPRSMPNIVNPGEDPGGIGSPRYSLWLQPAMAHELFHACAVYHHGRNPGPVTWVRVSPTTVIENASNSVSLLTEGSGVPDALWLPLGQPWDEDLAFEHDSHSGNDSCVMRYENARWYKSIPNPATIRYKVSPPELAGWGLCTSPLGTGLAGKRYGDAARAGDPGVILDRGNCAGQIRVDDTPPLPPQR